MEKRKKSERKCLKVYLKVVNVETDQLFGYMVDITDKGLMLTSEQPVATKASFRLRVDLSSQIEGRNEFDLSAQSMWSEKDDESGFYNTGFLFIDISPEDLKIIDQMIDKLCFSE